jgi:hypothetical protein
MAITRLDHILALANNAEPYTTAPTPSGSPVESAKPLSVTVTAGNSPKTLSRASNQWVSADLTAGSVLIYLPENPESGDVVSVEDSKLLAGNGNVLTVEGNGNNIDTYSSLVFDTEENRGAVTSVRYNGTLWKLF